MRGSKDIKRRSFKTPTPWLGLAFGSSNNLMIHRLLQPAPELWANSGFPCETLTNMAGGGLLPWGTMSTSSGVLNYQEYSQIGLPLAVAPDMQPREQSTKRALQTETLKEILTMAVPIPPLNPNCWLLAACLGFSKWKEASWLVNGVIKIDLAFEHFLWILLESSADLRIHLMNGKIQFDGV